MVKIDFRVASIFKIIIKIYKNNFEFWILWENI